MRERPDDWTPVVRKHWKQTTAYIVSSEHPSCLKMAKDEVRFIDRVMEHVPLEDIEALVPRGSWFMAVVLCPGDDLHGLAAWAGNQDTSRIHFYLHRNADAGSLAPWRDAGHPLNRIEEERFATYGKMHARLGLDLSDRVYEDFSP